MTEQSTSLQSARARDAADPLAVHRDQFVFADDTIYLDGNSLGRLPGRTAPLLAALVEQEWGSGLIRSWPRWLDRARTVADRIATGVLEVPAGTVVLSDSTTVNLYKVAAAALDARPGRRAILVEQDAFPTDLYVLQGLASARGIDLVTVETDLDAGLDLDVLTRRLTDDVALVCLSQVGYRSGALLDVNAVTAAVHEAGAMIIWDLSHSAGAVGSRLASSQADLAVGCTYKYLNGGPGAPAFVYVRQDLHAQLRQPIWGWFGQDDQFAMAPAYDPVAGIDRFSTGTPNLLGITAVGAGVDTVVAAGIDAVRAKGLALTSYLVELADDWLEPLGFRLASPRDPERRGSHVTLHHLEAWQACQALIDHQVVPDFRTPDRLRLGLSPLTTSYEDVWRALDLLRRLVTDGAHRNYPTVRSRVT